ncbi:MAG TPA: hypothetical protein VF763_04930 [Candidatus Limnocylindrales bacterium]
MLGTPRLRPALLALVAVLLAACGGASPSGSASPSGGSATGASPAPTGASSATASPSVRIGAYGLAIDPALVHLLPATVGGAPVTESPELEAAAMGDADLATHVSSYAAATVGSLGDPDWAQVQFLSLKPDAGKSFYPAWRDQVESAGCSQASGVASREQRTIGGWPVDVTTCVGGAMLYQLQLQDQGVLVSVTALGPKKLGEQAVAALGP